MAEQFLEDQRDVRHHIDRVVPDDRHPGHLGLGHGLGVLGFCGAGAVVSAGIAVSAGAVRTAPGEPAGPFVVASGVAAGTPAAAL